MKCKGESPRLIEPMSVVRHDPSLLNGRVLVDPLVLNVCCSAPASACQSRTVLSEADATRRSSGENATEQTQPEWHLIVRCRVPVSAFQSCTALYEADATRCPSGENATCYDISLFKGLAGR
jgi:hypothetical protein